MGTLCGCSLAWAGLHWLTVRAFTLMGADASCMDVHHLPSHVPFHATQGETHAEARGEFSCVLPLSRDQKISSFRAHLPPPHWGYTVRCMPCCACICSTHCMMQKVAKAKRGGRGTIEANFLHHHRNTHNIDFQLEEQLGQRWGLIGPHHLPADSSWQVVNLWQAFAV